MAALQARLLERAGGWVKPGGTLVFSTCSLEPQEGEAQLERFLAERPGFAVDPIRAEELPQGIAPREDGTLRLLPGMLAEQGGLDGFFIARLRRVA
jgi:16S rRNA (cytosine967-C5)-methyltransferase